MKVIKFLFITDLDNTLVGNRQATDALLHKLLLIREQIYVIYATGRSIHSASDLKTDQGLLEPDYWVTGVGSEIYHRGQQDQTWAARLSIDWNRAAIADLLRAYDELLPQPAAEQNPWKISYFLKPTADPTILTRIENQLADFGAKLIFSSGQDVDILPRSGDKGLAITYLREHLAMPPEKTVVCGDSGNDISLFQQGTLGIIVGNARAELLDWYSRYGTPQQYVANAPYAWGILEGLQHFGFL
ncbi:MAG: sucrose-phosphate phosphatase [Cyanobacteriota bacterium SKYGB_h_bin112]|nr:sucrose-phosphate phosphatase [Cyanobacteriota bacterium SKYGB_h_bin112]